MIHFVFEDTANIAFLCFLLGIGVVTFVCVMSLYFFALFLMEDFNDRN